MLGLLITFSVLFKNSSKNKIIKLIKAEPSGLFKNRYIGQSTHMQEIVLFIFILKTTQVQVLEIRINKLI